MKKYIPVLAVSLFISLFIYVFYRTEKTLINQLFIMLFDKETYTFLKTRINFYLPLPDFVIYSLPEGLWVFCITLTSNPFYLKVRKRKWDLIYVPILIAILSGIMSTVALCTRPVRLDGYYIIDWLLAAGFIICKNQHR